MTTRWDFDFTHSNVDFSVRHLLVSKVRGRFNKWGGTLVYDEKDPTRSSVEVTIDAASVDTSEPQRDTHLRSADFFDVAKFPTATFVTTGIESGSHDAKAKDATHTVTGNLTLHGVTKPVTFAVEGPSAPGKDPWGNTRIGLSATTKINRKDFGLSWNAALETGGVLVGEDVQITLEVQFIKA